MTADVRGEVFMPKAEFARINEERGAAGLPLYANPRNSGAGSLRQIDSSVTASRKLSAWFYQLLEEGIVPWARPLSTGSPCSNPLSLTMLRMMRTGSTSASGS